MISDEKYTINRSHVLTSPSFISNLLEEKLNSAHEYVGVIHNAVSSENDRVISARTLKKIKNALEATRRLQDTDRQDAIKPTIDVVKEVIPVIQDLCNETRKENEDDASDLLEELEKITHELDGITFEVRNALDGNLDLNISDKEKDIKKLASRIEMLEADLSELEQSTVTPVTQAEEILREATERLKNKEEEVNQLVELISGKAIAGSYEKTAAEEKQLADYFRFASIFFMVAMVSVIGFSFYESTKETFDLNSALFRIGLTLILSIPAAYLARESSKHRDLQNNYLKTALDLKAVHPYIASLPEESQNSIKAKVADRVFAQKNNTNSTPGSFPINAQDIATEIIKRFEK